MKTRCANTRQIIVNTTGSGDRVSCAALLADSPSVETADVEFVQCAGSGDVPLDCATGSIIDLQESWSATVAGSGQLTECSVEFLKSSSIGTKTRYTYVKTFVNSLFSQRRIV